MERIGEDGGRREAHLQVLRVNALCALAQSCWDHGEVSAFDIITTAVDALMELWELPEDAVARPVTGFKAEALKFWPEGA